MLISCKEYILENIAQHDWCEHSNFLAEKYKNDTKVKSFVDKLTKCQDLEEFLDNAQKNSGRLLNLCRQKKS